MVIQTRAYVVEEKGGPFVLRDVVLDDTGSDEILVEMKYTGLCHTDIVVQHGGMPIGDYPAVLGHEGVGVIREIGSQVTNKSLKEGDLVFLSFRSCQECSACRSGRCGACPHMTEYNFVRSRLDKSAKPLISYPDGTPIHGQFFGQSSLSQMAIVSERSVVKCESDITNIAPLAPLGCGYLTGAGAVFNVCKPEADSTMVILGMGAVGIAALLAAKSLGVNRIIGVDNVDQKLEMASSLGATHSINTQANPGLAKSVREYFPEGADYILDTTGVPVLLQDAPNALAHGGTLVMVGVPPADANVQINALDMLVSCKKVMGVIEGYARPQELIPRLVQLYKEGNFPVDKLAKVYPGTQLDVALDDLKTGKVVKPILSWDNLS